MLSTTTQQALTALGTTVIAINIKDKNYSFHRCFYGIAIGSKEIKQGK